MFGDEAMFGTELVFQLLGLLLGLSIAELLTGLARSSRISAGAARESDEHVRIGWIVPLLGMLVLLDQTHFWITAYELRQYLPFHYLTLIGVIAIIGGYYVLSTFVFPDEPSRWPDFDEYYLRTKRTIAGGMIAANLATIVYGGVLVLVGFPIGEIPIARHWLSISAAGLYCLGLVALWFAQSKRTNLALLLTLCALLLIIAVGSELRA